MLSGTGWLVQWSNWKGQAVIPLCFEHIIFTPSSRNISKHKYDFRMNLEKYSFSIAKRCCLLGTWNHVTKYITLNYQCIKSINCKERKQGIGFQLNENCLPSMRRFPSFPYVLRVFPGVTITQLQFMLVPVPYFTSALYDLYCFSAP